MKLVFSGPLWYRKGPAPHYFVTVPDDERRALKAASKLITYGRGMIPVRAQVGGTGWKTSLYPHDGACLVPPIGPG